MMSVGMIATIFSKKTRFSNLRRKLDELRTKRTTTLMMFLFLSTTVVAQDSNTVDSLILSTPISQEHSNKFGMLVVQDEGGRMKPFGTTTSEKSESKKRLQWFEFKSSRIRHAPKSLLVAIGSNDKSK